MSSSALNSINTARNTLEIEFSGKIYEAEEIIESFVRKYKINSLVLYLDKVDSGLLDLLLDFCVKAGKKQISCRAVIEYEEEVMLDVLFRNNIRTVVRICTEEALQKLIAVKEHYPEIAVELYYDRSRQYGWNITRAMELCRENSINCSFGCSKSFIEAEEEELSLVCGDKAKTAFPGSGCRRFINTLFMTKDGVILPCCGLKDMPVGNIFAEDYDECIANSTVLSYYDDYMSKIKKPCRECAYFSKCAGCRGRAYQYSADFLAADPTCQHNVNRKNEIAKLPVKDPENYMPHQKPMLMVSELLDVKDCTCETLSVIGEDNPFLQSDGRLHPAALVEIGAQSMAFLDAFLHPESTLQGMLVEVQKFEYSSIAVYKNDCLRIYSRKLYEMPPWNIGSFRIVTDDGEFVAEGEVKVCQLQNS